MNNKQRFEELREETILDIVDIEMRPIIKDLRAQGLETFTCCQSGPNHSFPFPTIRVSHKQSKKKVLKGLNDAGYTGWDLSEVMNKSGNRLFWHIEFRTKTPKDGVFLTYGEWHPMAEIRSLRKRLYFLLSSAEKCLGHE